MSKKKSAFPTRLYIKIEKDEDGGGWFNTCASFEQHAETGKSIVVGVYDLVNTGEIVAAPDIIMSRDEA